MRSRRVRPTTVLACLALLATLVRVLLPALHTHGHAHALPGGPAAATATCCECGQAHAPAAPREGAPTGATAHRLAAAHTCLACELELGTPPAPPPPPPAPVAFAGAAAGTVAPPLAAPTQQPRTGGHRCRAPPPDARPFG